MNIRECIDSLNTATEAINGAPEKGFLDLDSVRDTIQKTRVYLEKITSQFDLGINLKEDTIASLKSKINALKIAGYARLFVGVEQALDSDRLNFEQLKSLQTEIDRALSKCFNAPKIPVGNTCPANLNDYH